MVIDKGCIVEQGTHDQLIEQEGTYKKLVLRQLNVGDGNTPGSMTATPNDTPTLRRRQVDNIKVDESPEEELSDQSDEP